MIGFQCDPLQSLNPKTDSSLLFARLLHNAGYEIFMFEPANISLTNDLVEAHGHILSFGASDMDLPIVIAERKIDLRSLRACFIRQNPPYDLKYIFNMHILERLENSVQFFNPPSAIRNFPEKLSPLNFKGYIPNTIVSNNVTDFTTMLKKHGAIVMKSLYGFGGFDVIKVSSHDELTSNGAAFIKMHGIVIAQEFLEGVYTGDKRILILDGKVVGFFRRLPTAGSFITNTIKGGDYELCDLTAK